MEFDLVIVGAGPVGTATALAAGSRPVALLQTGPTSPATPPSAGFDARVYALSPGNVDFLRTLGACPGLPRERLTPIHEMRVFGDDGRSSIVFDAYRAGVAELAWTVEDALLQEALRGALERSSVTRVEGECGALESDGEGVVLRLLDGRDVRTKLLIGADGARSFVRRAAGIPAAEKSYAQTAVVANFACERAHRNTAYQWFANGAVLALLPLPGEHVSLVWSLPSAEAERVLALEAQALCLEVERAGKGAVGALRLVTPPRSYPLTKLSARRLIGERVALVGDAAHVIHPLAGQGLNLGLQDVRELAGVVRAAGDPGARRVLRQYERSRAEPILAMDLMVDGLQRLFAAEGRGLARARNAGLNLVERVPVLKNLLMRRAMG